MEFLKCEKSTRILGFPGFWHFFRIYKIPLESTLTGREKCHLFCCLGVLIDIRVTAGYFYDTFAYEICFYGIDFYGIYIYIP
jgi:hypothetical protein